MVVVGLTGGIGAGKSTVAAMLAERGAVIVDTDLVAREVVAPGGPAHDAVRGRFGTLDRSELADIVFSDPDALADLNTVVHPAVRAAVAERLAAESGGDRVVVLVVPLLVESGSDYPTAGVLVVDCPEDVAVRRAVDGRGMVEADVRRRLAAQATRAQRLAAADYVLVNDGDLDRLGEQVDDAWAWMRSLPSRVG